MSSIKKKRFTIFLAIVCFLTGLSQLPFLVNEGLTRYLSFPSWFIVILVLFFSGVIKLGKIEIKVVFIGMLFLFGVFFSELATPFNHFSSNLLAPFYMSLLLILIGLFSSNLLERNSINYIVKAYIISMIIVSFNVYIEYFSTGFDWDSRIYAYGAKNSISQMILTGLIFLYLLYKPRKILLLVFKWLLLVCWIVLLFALKSRASILGLFIMIAIVVLSKLDIKKRLFTILVVTIGGVLIMINPELNRTVIDGVLLGGRDASLDDISSGRMTHITVLFPLFIEGNELLGTGTLYVENFILNSILKHGLLFGWILIAVAIWPLVWGLKNLNKSNPINITFIIIALVYFTNGLFEAQAPFGPGTKNYILWLMFGILYGINRKKNINKQITNSRISSLS